MHLHSLELFGFKSFADKITLNFHEGITSIVGPNGCGKSNVLDAVRWVLGEQSAKSLRGGEMADVIFNGTDTRKPLGFAEVSLTLTDCTTELGVDWHEVRVTRRVYRDGNSEYFLNKTPCRLRDIQSLFADTGVARSAYSMMEQGKIDLILSSRPEDRRAVFEEAAGITKYKTQKREALRKLEATEANLLRISDIIKEVKRQIGSLQRQAGKARRYQALLADLQVLDTHQSRKHLETLEQELAGCRSEIKRVSEEESATRAKIDHRESELANRRSNLDAADAEIGDARAEVERLQSEIAAQRSRIEFNRQRADEISELIGRAKGEIAAAQAKRAQQQLEMKELSALVEKTAQVLQTKQAELTRLTELATRLRADRIARESELQTLQLTFSKNESRVSSLGDDLAGMAARREATVEHLSNLDAEIAGAEETRKNAEKSLQAARHATEGEQKNVELLLSAAQAAEASLQQHRHFLNEAEKNLTAIERALAEKESRLDVLKQLNEEGEGLAQGSQAVLRGVDDLAEFRAAVAGSLVAQFDVDPKFIHAIEAALGRNLHAIVLQDAALAADIIHKLTRKKLGKAALLIPQLNGSAQESVRKVLPKDALVWATDKVVAPRSLEILVRQLLGGVVIFSNLEQALACKKADPTLAMATLSGEFISVEGIVFGGSSSVQKESLLERKNRISILHAEHSVLQEQRKTLEQKRDEARSSVEKGAARLEELRAQHRAADLAQTAAGGKIAILEREVDLAADRLEELRSEKATLTQQVQAADERIAAVERELSVARTDFAGQQKHQEQAGTARETAIAEEAKCLEQLNELRLTLATEQQRHDHLVTQRQPMNVRETELGETITARRADIANFENRLLAQAGESKSAENMIEQESARREERKAALSALVAKRSETAATLHAAEAELREVRNSLNELHERRAAQQVRESQLQMKIDNLVDHVQRRYHLDLRGFATDEAAFGKILRAQLKRREGGSSAPSNASAARTDANNGGEAALASTSPAERPIHPPSQDPHEVAPPEIDKVIADLTQQLDNMGPVNLDAVQEYDELEERYRFLETQNNDLTTSRRDLLDVIARINSTTQKLFTETFAQVRTNFREMFAELFGGGRADLSLMDENDPLNCGIDISAKPPGKQWQAVSLLSGGERTMTAVALLFAIYMVRPSPFCVLDEMDAALDETNINRFIRVLERFVAQSQFIIITHNKRTIAKADILYGITMEERGVSKLVGMKLTERPENYAEPASNGNGHGAQRHFALEGAGRETPLAATR
jgi:chromosome segregation protein